MNITVYITSYNKSKYLSQAITSVLSQSLAPKEIIIIDDYSNDNSRDIINSFYNRYPNMIKPIFNDRNLGIAKTRNIAISHCKSELITFVDGDDYFFPLKLESEHERLNENNYGCVYSNHVFITEEGKEIKYFSDKEDDPAEGDIFIENFNKSFYVSSGSNFHNEIFYKSHALEAGLYDGNIQIWEDWDFRIRMSKIIKFGYCSRVNSAYRLLESGLHNASHELNYREQIKIYIKNKSLLQDLKKEEKNLIHNQVYSKIKISFSKIIEKNRKDRKILLIIYYCFHLIIKFRTRKSIFYALKSLLGIKK